MNEPYKTLRSDDKILNIYQDSEGSNPREWDNLGTMICEHRRYSLGDKHDFNFSDYNGWDEYKKAIEKKHKTGVILPLFLYDHSGITISTTPFSCRWDSGQLGFIYISKEKIRKEFNVKRINAELLEKVTKHLISEVGTYDQYLTGDVYGFEITDNDGNHLDSCYGFFGSDFANNGICEHLDSELAELLKND